MTTNERIYKDLKKVIKICVDYNGLVEKTFIYNQMKILNIKNPYYSTGSWISAFATIRSITSGIRRGYRKGKIFNTEIGMKRIGNMDYYFIKERDFNFDRCSYIRLR